MCENVISNSRCLIIVILETTVTFFHCFHLHDKIYLKRSVNCFTYDAQVESQQCHELASLRSCVVGNTLGTDRVTDTGSFLMCQESKSRHLLQGVWDYCKWSCRACFQTPCWRKRGQRTPPFHSEAWPPSPLPVQQRYVAFRSKSLSLSKCSELQPARVVDLLNIFDGRRNRERCWVNFWHRAHFDIGYCHLKYTENHQVLKLGVRFLQVARDAKQICYFQIIVLIFFWMQYSLFRHI